MMAVAIENTAESQLEDDWGSLCIVSEVAQVIKEEEGEEKIEVLFVGPYMHKPICKNVVPEQTDMEWWCNPSRLDSFSAFLSDHP